MRKNCETCKHNYEDSLYDLPCKECEHTSDAPTMWKPAKQFTQTNADRIRAMSDEELAIHLHDFGWDCHLCAEHRRLDNEPLLRGEKCDENCMGHCLEWLKQPAEGE